MSQVYLKLKPNVIGALLPHYFFWFKVFGVVSILTYFGMKYVAMPFYPHSPTALKIWLVTIAIFFPVFMVKHRILRYHRTTYYFYSNRFVYEYDLITRKRKTIPYSQIRQLDHDQKMWQRFLDIADIQLAGDGISHTLYAIKSPEKTEHKIYSLMKMKPALHKAKEIQEEIDNER